MTAAARPGKRRRPSPAKGAKAKQRAPAKATTVRDRDGDPDGGDGSDGDGALALPGRAPARSSPAMAEIDADVLEFIEAIDRFKKQHNRPFPNWSEVLYVLRKLGYARK